MDEPQPTQTQTPPKAEYAQLTQVRVPLEDAGEAFSERDATGRIPIVVVPLKPNRIRNEFVGAGLIAVAGGVLAGILLELPYLIPISIVVGLILIVLGIYQSFFLRIPEGASGLLVKAGKYQKTVGSGSHLVPPWILVSHLVSRREIPFDAPAVEALTKDNVRAYVDTLLTFKIVDAYRFIYSISAADFDQVFQAACQDILRSMIRKINADQVADLKKQDMEPLIESLTTELESYGVTISKVSVTYAQPPADFVHSQEMRQLAVFQQSEQTEVQSLAKRRQADGEALARQRAEAEAENEEYRLAKLEERLRRYPLAAKWEWDGARLGVSKALAANSRAMLRITNASDIFHSFFIEEPMEDGQTLGPKEAENSTGD
jgi:regulator of protease activity HflC (stomatin/prohibitin superfamily)